MKSPLNYRFADKPRATWTTLRRNPQHQAINVFLVFTQYRQDFDPYNYICIDDVSPIRFCVNCVLNRALNDVNAKKWILCTKSLLQRKRFRLYLHILRSVVCCLSSVCHIMTCVLLLKPFAGQMSLGMYNCGYQWHIVLQNKWGWGCWFPGKREIQEVESPVKSCKLLPTPGEYKRAIPLLTAKLL